MLEFYLIFKMAIFQKFNHSAIIPSKFYKLGLNSLKGDIMHIKGNSEKNLIKYKNQN